MSGKQVRARKRDRAGKNAALRALRAYALAGDLKQAEQILLRMLQEQPDDTFAAEELHRLRTGVPLRITETKEQRRLREEKEQQEETLRALSDFREKQLDWHNLDELQLRRYAASAASLPPQEHLVSFRHAIGAELRRRANHRRKTVVCTVLGILLTTGIICAGVCRHDLALAKSEALELALRSGHWELIHARLKDAKHPIDRILSTQLRNSVALAETWIEQQHAQRDELLRLISHWQNNPAAFASLSDLERSRFADELTALVYPHQDMLDAWHELMEQMKQSLLAKRSSVIAVLAKPLPPPPQPTSSLETDTQALETYRQGLMQRIRFYREACTKHTLSEELIEPAKQALHHTELALRDLAELQRLLHNLQQAQSYAHYRSLIDEFTPAHYAPARQLIAPLRQLPPAQDLEQTVRDGGGGVAHQVLESTLLNAGPTFSAERPATREQTAIIEGVFTSEPLHRVFFKLRNKEGETCITEKDPVVFSQTKGYQDAKIIRSTYDPAYTPSKPAGFIWTEAETIMKTTIDATPLIKATGIERETFFEQANLPTLLDTIINAEAPYCPPLARAYLFHAILQLILKHPEPEITGIHFCPSLQQDAHSFLSIIRRSRQTFTDGMWLRDGSDIDWLNTTYGRWFRERKGKSYAQEIADNVRQLINVRPKFAGLIGLRGEIICSPRIKSRLTPGTRIWYLRQPHSTESTSDSHAGLSIGTMGTPLSRPLPLSPFFIAEKE